MTASTFAPLNMGVLDSFITPKNRPEAEVIWLPLIQIQVAQWQPRRFLTGTNWRS